MTEHVLEFIFSVGRHELDPQVPITLSTWDLNRLIHGAGADFTPAPRILSSGGGHVQYRDFYRSLAVPKILFYRHVRLNL
jgi:hypothetical protein